MARPKPCHVHPSKPKVRIHISLSNLFRPNSATSDSELRTPTPTTAQFAGEHSASESLDVCYGAPCA
ncbi:hypothetical protein CsSME_00024391 [Camellia sinensis var. sinensis]